MIIHIISDKNPPYDPFDDLVIAIIKQATDDYRSAAKMIAETGSRFEKKLGDWYLLLSGRDNGPQILERLDQEVFKND